MVHACRVCQGPFPTQGFIILATIGTEKDTLVFYSTQIEAILTCTHNQCFDQK